MLVLFCIQVVQTNKNESSWKLCIQTKKTKYYLCYYEKNLSRFTLHDIHKVQGWHRIHKAFWNWSSPAPCKEEEGTVSNCFGYLRLKQKLGNNLSDTAHHLSTIML